MCAQWHIFALLTISLTGYYITTAYIHLTESIIIHMKMKMLEITLRIKSSTVEVDRSIA